MNQISNPQLNNQTNVNQQFYTNNLKPQNSIKKTIIPNELKITINNNIPGYQKINYTPNMTIPNINKNDKTISFNPLIKLNQNVINNIPEDLRKQQFFNPGLFESLLRFNGVPPKSTLEEAMFYGIIDNNIKVTLDTLFPSNSVIYIAKKPYVIVDVQWSKGNWKIDTKQKLQQIDINKIIDPYLYTTIVRDEIISGEDELNNLPENVIYGPNFNGQKNIEMINNENVINEPSAPLEPQIASPLASGIKKNNKIDETYETNQLQYKKNAPLQITNDLQEKEQQLQPQPQQPKYKNVPLQITNDEQEQQLQQLQPKYKNAPLQITNDVQEQQEYNNVPLQEAEILEDNQPVPEIKLTGSNKSTSYLRSFFNADAYFSLLNVIYTFMNPIEKKYLYNILSKTTSINLSKDSKNLSKTAYKEIVQGLSVNQNTGKGDCFFIAVADAINYHNYTNPNNKIIYNNYGIGNMLFTPACLRNIVSTYILTLPNLDTYEAASILNSQNMNEQFEKQLKQIQEQGQNNDIEESQYVQIANDVYKNNDNFFVKNVNKVPILENRYYNPFEPMEKDNYKKYIESNDYWANELSIDALCKELKLNIIPIENITINNENTLRVPYANFDGAINNWNKYLFLYYNSYHYELISFSFKERQIKKTNKTTRAIIFKSNKIVIFNRQEKIFVPPIYILFIIFGSYYFSQSEEFKKSFTFFPDIMKAIETSFLKIMSTYNIISIKNLYKKFFPYTKYNQNSNNQNLLGGAYYNPHFSSKYYVNKMLKPENPSGDSHIAYYISIDMDLYPGTSLPPEKLKNLSCIKKLNNIKKAYSDFTGRSTMIQPTYQYNVNKYKDTKKQISQKKGGKTIKRKSVK